MSAFLCLLINFPIHLVIGPDNTIKNNIVHPWVNPLLITVNILYRYIITGYCTFPVERKR